MVFPCPATPLPTNARPTGAATARLLARDGFDVAIVDRATSPSDTLSTYSLSRRCVVQFNRWGLLDAVLESGAPAIRRVELHSPKGVLARMILLDAAVEAGAQLHTGLSV